MLDIKVIATGSSGNSYLVADQTGNKLLLECGITFTALKKALRFNFKGIQGCLVSHEHKDHCRCIADCLGACIECYCSVGTATALNLKHHRLHHIKAGKQIKIGSWNILPFEAMHDAVEPLCFLIQNGEDKLLFATDTYYIKHKFVGLTDVLIECNYDLEALNENIETGNVNEARKKRILRSHMNLDTCKGFFLANDIRELRSITLIHVSNDNGVVDKFKKEIEAITGIPVVVA